MIPEPPANVADWLVLLGLLGAFIEAARRRLVNPLLKAMYDHAEQHAMLVHELVANGSEHELPYELRQKPLRKIAIKSYIAIQEHAVHLSQHDHWIREALADVNADRQSRGLPLVHEPHKEPDEK